MTGGQQTTVRLPEAVQVDAMGGGADVAEREAAVVVFEGADRDRDHRGSRPKRHVIAEGDARRQAQRRRARATGGERRPEARGRQAVARPG